MLSDETIYKINRWVEALRSGKYEQGSGYLCKRSGGVQRFCCLGVLCEEEGMERTAGAVLLSKTLQYNYSSPLNPELSSGAIFPMKSGELKKFLGRKPTAAPKSVGSARGTRESALVALNDGGTSFIDIADLIELWKGEDCGLTKVTDYGELVWDDQAIQQRAFWMSWRGLESQGWKRSIEEGGGCQSRDREGRHCAVAWLIPKQHVVDAYNGYPEEDVCLQYNQLSKGCGLPRIHSFYDALMVAHDSAQSSDEVKANYLNLANQYGLQVPPPR